MHIGRVNMDSALKNTKILVILVESKAKLIIPLKWLHNTSGDMSWIINWGIKKGRDRKIFFSPNENDDADFGLEARGDFCSSISACYMARVIKSCGKYFRSTQNIFTKISMFCGN